VQNEEKLNYRSLAILKQH